MVTLTPQQVSAVKAVGTWYRNTSSYMDIGADKFWLGGYAGSGKSTIMPDMIEELGVSPDQIAFCAPTGKAAMVMGNKLKAQGIMSVPSTIHKLIYRPGREKVDTLQNKLDALKTERGKVAQGLHENYGNEAVNVDSAKLKELNKSIDIVERDLDKAYSNPECPGFQLNVDSNLRQKRLIVVDEASMVGTSIAEDLSFFNVPILAIGDPGQLPPVGDTPGLTVGEPDFFLSEIHRQAKDNPIIWLATLARNGEPLPLGNHGGLVHVVGRRNDRATLDIDRDLKVICGTNKKRWRLTSKIRNLMGLSGMGPCEGEPLIMCRNSRVESRMELVNGLELECAQDIGKLVDGTTSFLLKTIDPESGNKYTLPVVQSIFEEHRFQERNASTADKIETYNAKRVAEHVDWGHVITCHKSQGSQWDEVVVHDESGAFRDESAQWLYTAITRAAQRLTVVV